MEIAIQIILSLVGIICLLGGANLLLKGAMSFLPEGTPPQVTLDNIVRFLSAIYFGMGFLLAWVIFNMPQVHELVYFLGIVVGFSGLGRLYSRIKSGPGGTYLFSVMLLEIALGIALVVLQYLR